MKICKICGVEYAPSSTDIDTCNSPECHLTHWQMMHPDISPAPRGRGKDLTGQTFERLKVERPVGRNTKGSVIWKCLCKCGRSTSIPSQQLMSGGVLSCGCLYKETHKEQASKALKEGREKVYQYNTNLNRLCMKPQSNNASGVPGVSFIQRFQKWRAAIGFQGKTYSLGYHKEFGDAVKARKEAEERLHGDFLAWYEREK